MSGRKITQYENLTLPGDTDAYYFPASHYQPENKIILRATNNITTDRPITILSGADYEFVAGESITLGADFQVDAGATFTARIENGNQNSRKKEIQPEDAMLEKLRAVNLPQQLDFDEQKYFQEFDIDITREGNVLVFPNPATDVINIMFNDISEISYWGIYSLMGEQLYLQNTINETESIDVQKYPSGLYILKVQYLNGKSDFIKIVISG